MAAPEIKKMVYNRIVFLVSGDANDALISDFKIEYLYELQHVFGMDILTDPADIEDETKYSMPQRSLVADLVAINFLTRQSVQNMEGLAGADATGNSLLKVAKAGEVEVEFSNPKAADGNKLLMTADKLMAFYKSEASRKALLQGFILDFNEVGAMVIEVMSRPSPGLSNQNYSFGNDCD